MVATASNTYPASKHAEEDWLWSSTLHDEGDYRAYYQDHYKC